MGAKKQPTPTDNQAINLDASKQLFKRFYPVMLLLAIGFIGGLLWLIGLRYFLVDSSETHYHANFAVYINGEREMFDDFTYFEEVAACTSAYSDSPKGRVHMHDKVNDVIHVHDKRVSYGNFFQNIGWSVGKTFIASRDQVYQTNESDKVVYVLNGEVVSDIATRIIGNEDKLLVSFGSIESNFVEQFESVPSNAGEVNTRPDPASCAGAGNTDGFVARLKRATFGN